MKRQLLTVALAGGLALGGLATVAANPDGHAGHRGGWGGDENMVEHLTKKLDLTPAQQAQVQPIVDQAKPQLQAIHQEAMQKAKAVMEQSMAQLRPMLTPDQQQKLDAMRAGHEQKLQERKAKHGAGQH